MKSIYRIGNFAGKLLKAVSNVSKYSWPLNWTQDEQDIVRLVVIEGTSLRAAGKKLGVSAMTIQRRLKRALARLRDLLNSD